MFFKRTTQAVQPCKNHQQRCSHGRARVGARRYDVYDHMSDVTPAALWLLAEVGQAHLISLLEDALAVAARANRDVLDSDDVDLARRLRGNGGR